MASDATCPQCGAPLPGTAARLRVYVGGVEVDVCNVHGTWFDKDELHRIWAVLLDGRRPAYDYAPAAAQALEDMRHGEAILPSLLGVP
jgi:Zn-finger nucleic acid-binding protein